MAEENTEEYTPAGAYQDPSTTVGNQFMNNSNIVKTMQDAYDKAQEEPAKEESKPEPSPEAETEESEVTDAPEGEVTGETEQLQESEPAEETSKDTEVSEDAEEVAEPATQPPPTLSADIKKHWDKIDPELQESLAKREKAFANGIRRYSEDAKHSQAIRKIEQPYEAIMRSENVDSLSAYQNFLSNSYTFRNGTPQQKTALIQSIIDQFGVEMKGNGDRRGIEYDDFEDFDDNPDKQPVDLRVNQLTQQVNQLTSHLNNQENLKQNDERAFYDKQISDFKNNGKHPDFDALNVTMQGLMVSGAATSLEQAYQMAARAHPTISKNVQRQADKKRIGEAKKKAAQAKKTAGTNLSSKGGRVAESNKTPRVSVGKMPDIDATLHRAYEEAQSSE